MAVVAIGMVIFTLVTLKRGEQQTVGILGFRLLIVLSDSMSATDFNAGDLILIKEMDPAGLEAGDIIVFTSGAEENYGEQVAHKIRRLTTDEAGNPGFVTYGTSTGEDDRL